MMSTTTLSRRVDAAAKRARLRPTAATWRPPTFGRGIVEFATGDDGLGMHLFPRQGTLLKVMTGDVGNLTEFDHRVIAGWATDFALNADGDKVFWSGDHGTPGDLLKRIGWNREHRRRWFREILLLIGRRGSKGYLSGIFGAWVLWHQLTDGDPHERHGMDPRRRITFAVVAGKKDQAVANTFNDLKGVIEYAECFKPYLAKVTRDAVYLFTPRQLAEGVDTNRHDLALIVIKAVETNALAQRGSAVLALFLDEFAHLTGSGSTSDSIEVYNAAMPATLQFGADAAILQTTSPWDQQGQAWLTYQRACAVDAATGEPADPDILMVQLTSQDLYLDWDTAHTIPMWPDGPCFPGGRKPIVIFDERMERERLANPDTYDVEILSHFRKSLLAYLPAGFVDRLFAPYQGALLEMQTVGRLSVVYVGHADPSLSQANFGFAIAHLEEDDDGIPHVLFDLIHHWSPADFLDGIVDYTQIQQELFGYIEAFGLSQLTFDRWNSAGSIQWLRDQVHYAHLPRHCDVSDLNPTAQLNWDAYEMFKTALGHNIIHAPHYALAEAEARAVQLDNGKLRPPTSGPVQTKDVLDAMVFATYNLIGNQFADICNRLASLPLRASFGPAPGTSPRAPAAFGRPVQPSAAERLSSTTQRQAYRYTGRSHTRRSAAMARARRGRRY